MVSWQGKRKGSTHAADLGGAGCKGSREEPGKEDASGEESEALSSVSALYLAPAFGWDHVPPEDMFES